MPSVTVITPTNSLKWIERAKKSLLKQTFLDWEWLVVTNNVNANKVRECIETDPRIHAFPYTGPKNPDGGYNVGALKNFASQHATSDLIVEFDHDDELAANCLEEVFTAFEKNPKAVFVYSDAVRVKETGEYECFGESWGWSSRDDTYMEEVGRLTKVRVANNPLEIPQNVSRIWYAPDHVRAWRKGPYLDVGGHDISLKVCDDLDLMSKLYKVGEFHHIPKVLYKYYIHGQNTWIKNVELIQNLTWSLHDKHIQEMALVHCQRNGLIAADLGGGINSPKGWLSVDQHDCDVMADLNGPWPFKDSTVGAFRAQDVLEHLKNPIHVMNEAYRCLNHGGLFLIEVPSTDGRGAFQDPTHVSFWNTNNFWYYTRADVQKYIKHAGVNCKFQVVRIANYYPTPWHEQHKIVYAKVHLAAIKDGGRLHGEIHI